MARTAAGGRNYRSTAARGATSLPPFGDSSARMVVDGAPARGRALPDQREPARLLGLAAARQRPARRRERRVRTDRAHRELLEPQLLDRPAVLEVMLAECLLDGRDARPRAVLRHEGHARVIDREVAREVAAVERLGRGRKGLADRRFVRGPVGRGERRQEERREQYEDP